MAEKTKNPATNRIQQKTKNSYCNDISVFDKLQEKNVSLLGVACQEGFKVNRQKDDELIGNCLFCGKKDKLYINNDKQTYKCFVCDSRGGILDFFSKIKNVNKGTAIKILLGEQEHQGEKYVPTAKNLPSLSKKEPKRTKYFKGKGEVARYDYKDAEGNLKYIKVKWLDKDGKKQFTAYENVNGTLLSGRGQSVSIPYNLEEVLRAGEESIYILEGEKDVETLRSLGLIATTGGSSSDWMQAFNEYFEGKNVVIIPDCDVPGKRYSEKITENIKDIVKTLKVVNLGLVDGGDVTDYLNMFGKNELLKKITPLEAENMDSNNVLKLEISKKWLIKNVSPHGKISYQINETEFVNELILNRKLFCVNEKLYDKNGFVCEGEIKSFIHSKIEGYIHQGQSKKTKDLYDALCLKTYYEPTTPSSNEIHFKNISFKIVDDGFKKIKSPNFVITRIDHDFNNDVKECPKWMNFLNCLFQEIDILTVQEYVGYCFLATTKAQKALFIRSGGGEGKSVLIGVLQKVFSGNFIRDKVQGLADNQFKLATLENKLVFFDDDLNTAGLTDTGLFKEIVTNTGKMTIEEKHKGSRSSDIFARFFCIGNNDITSLFDHSDAFYDRLIPLKTRGNKFRGAKGENVNLIEELSSEIPAIIKWALNGLKRLHDNGYKFTLSPQTLDNLCEIRRSNDNVSAFFNSGYIEFEDEKTWGEYSVSVAELEKSYVKWCLDNCENPKRGFPRAFKQVVESDRNIVYKEQMVLNKRRCRGYEGIRISEEGKQ
jgi:putative DNA primase/helicase